MTSIGKKVIIRTLNAGCHFGTLTYKESTEVVLDDAIRLWEWAGAFTLSQLAMDGPKDPEGCKFAMPVDRIILQYTEIIECSDKAIEAIETVPPWKV